MRAPTVPSKVRVQLDLTAQQTQALDMLRDRCGFRSRADAVKAALAILGWVQSETQMGRKVVAIDGQNASWFVMAGITDRGAQASADVSQYQANRS
jgi:ribose/xylose/arabinose/galactoside ABC-type transport system permease subunit